jgi:hypothetical protein
MLFHPFSLKRCIPPSSLPLPLYPLVLINGGCAQVYGLAGITLGSIVQSLSTITGGVIVGLIYGWKLTLVGFSQSIFCYVPISCGLAQLTVA